MKARVFGLIFLAVQLNAKAQDNNAGSDTLLNTKSMSLTECPSGLRQYINKDSLQHKAVLFIFNNSLHPLGRFEFSDHKNLYRGLKTNIRMNRCILLYIDTGLHLFHTMYQLNGDSVNYHVGEIFIARLITRTTWPPFYPVRRKGKNGELEEFGPVLFNYINAAAAEEDLERIKKKEVMLNE